MKLVQSIKTEASAAQSQRDKLYPAEYRRICSSIAKFVHNQEQDFHQIRNKETVNELCDEPTANPLPSPPATLLEEIPAESRSQYECACTDLQVDTQRLSQQIVCMPFCYKVIHCRIVAWDC